MKKKILIAIAIMLLILVCIPFIPYIYKKYTKPLWKNHKDDKEWYNKTNPEDIDQVRNYCKRRGYDTNHYIFVDFSIPSGKKRFFIYNLKTGKKEASSYCMHGSGPGNTAAKPKFSNKIGSKCSSVGRYIMVGRGNKYKNSVRLRGLDNTNSMAEARGILIHSAGKVTRFNGETDYIPLGKESEGCFTVSRNCMKKVMNLYANNSTKHPILIYAKYED